MYRYTLIFIIFFLISCVSFKPKYLSGVTYNVEQLLDSIQDVDNILIPDTSVWLKTSFITNQGVVNAKLFYLKQDKKQYIITLVNQDTVEHYKYRIE